MSEEQPEQHPEMAPDPDEDDLSDLDDMLDDFAATSIKDKKQDAPPTTTTTTTAPLPPTTSSASDPPESQPSAEDEEEFARQLQAGMAELLGGLGDDPDMQKQFAEMMKELSLAAEQEASASASGTTAAIPTNPSATTTASNPAPTSTTSSSSTTTTAKPAFASTIEKTMNRMQASGQSASAAAATSSEDDMLAQMLKELESGNFPNMDGMGGGGGDFNQMLMGMMEQLVNKDILYEPMKELEENFPDWLVKNKDATPKQDLDRYITQQAVVKEIVQRFEKKDFNDDNKEDREFIVEKMQEMQAAGAPPPGLVGDMNAAQDMMSEADGCPQQ